MELNVVDIIIIAIVGIFALAGFVKGFMASLLKLFSSIVSLAIGIWLAKPVSIFINNIIDVAGWFATQITTALQGAHAFFNNLAGDFTPNATLSGVELKNLIGTNLADMGRIFQSVLSLFINDSAEIASDVNLGVYFGEILGGVALLIASAIAIFIAIRIVVSILSKIFDALTKNPAINGLDKLLGLALGALKGGLIIVILVGIIIGVGIMFSSLNNLLLPYIEQSVIGEYIFNTIHSFVSDLVANIDFNTLIQGLFAQVAL